MSLRKNATDGQEAAPAEEGHDDSAGESSGPGGRMLYHLFAAEERRRMISIYLDNHAVAFSAAAMSDATGIDTATATEMLNSLVAVDFLVAREPNEAYQLAASDDPAVERIVGNVSEDPKFYHLNKGAPVAQALAKADSEANAYADDFLRLAPDIDPDR